MPILGYNTKGASNIGTSGGRKYVSKFTLASASTLTELHGWFTGTGATIQLVIYADSGGLPGARLAFTSPLTPTGADIELSQTGLSVALAAGTYWIGWASQNAGTVSAYYDDPGGPAAHQAQSSGAAYNPPSDPFGTPNASGTRNFSCWAVVTTTPTTTVGRFSRLKLKAPLVGTDVGGGVLEIDVGYPSYAALKAGVTSYADILA